MLRSYMVLSVLVASAVASAQPAPGDCTCAATLDWVATTFAANDAGYPAVVERKGADAYDAMLAGLAARADGPSASPECESLLREYLGWFRRGHVGISPTGREQPPTAGAPAPPDDELRARYADAPRLDLDLDAVRARFASAAEVSGPEGIWQSGDYEVAVVRADTAGAERYLGVTLASANAWWQPGQVKFEVYPEGGPDGGYGVIRLRDHSAAPLTGVDQIGPAALDLRPVGVYTRTAPAYAPDPAAQVFLDDRDAPEPRFRQLSPQTAYLRLPDFDASQKAAIDSVLEAHHTALTSTPNLVLDIRGNGGGADASYSRVLDYLYTTPIRQVSAELRSTPLNNARNDAFLADPEMPQEIKDWVREIGARLAATDAEWVPMTDEPVTVERRDTVYAAPARVAILTDERNGSTAEQFLLDARQSLKVKTYGVRTAGVLDVSNLNFVPSPCADYELAYSISRSFRIPEMAIDDVGLAPDFYLDAGVPRWQWVGHVQGLLEQD